MKAVAPRSDSEPDARPWAVERIPARYLSALGACLLAAAAFGLVWLRERSRARAARREALVDPLTGMPNRLAFHQRLSHEWRRARRYQRPLGLLALDMDGLKQINDGLGHAAGDDAIRAVGDAISNSIRDLDCAARLAGDEFVVLCPETNGASLAAVGDKIRAGLESNGIGISIGVAELDAADKSPEDLLARADQAMYVEKVRRRARTAETRTADAHSTTGRLGLATPDFSASRAS